MDLGLAGRSVLVTGASRGIGAAVAEVFAREGCWLHIAARSADGLAAMKSGLESRYGVEVAIHPVDLAARGSAEKLGAETPNIDVLVNNAGAIPRGDVLEIDEDRWRAGWELKVFGYINMTRHFYGRMRERRRGVIINIIGLAAEKIEYGYAAGSTGNAALVAFTRAVGSMSLDHGVRILGINPGVVETERSRKSLRTRSRNLFGDPERWPELVAELPGGRMLRPEEVADVTAFLASDRASGMCGHIVTIDGGAGARSYQHRR